MSRRAKTAGLGPPEGQPWWWMTNVMTAAITYRALGIHARRVLDFLLFEHASHGGQENGNLAATYRQLEDWGVTGDDVSKGLAELFATGFVEPTFIATPAPGKREPSRYALTWLPTKDQAGKMVPPSHRWLAVAANVPTPASTDPKQHMRDRVQAAKNWLKEETGFLGRSARRSARAKRLATSQVRLSRLASAAN